MYYIYQLKYKYSRFYDYCSVLTPVKVGDKGILFLFIRVLKWMRTPSQLLAKRPQCRSPIQTIRERIDHRVRTRGSPTLADRFGMQYSVRTSAQDSESQGIFEVGGHYSHFLAMQDPVFISLGVLAGPGFVLPSFAREF